MLAIAGALLCAAPALADVESGVDAWGRGDYARAVAEWQGPAAKGNPDAQYNLAQAYRLGRGVPQDTKKAEELYAKAAALGHPLAADNYGLMLFQQGRKSDAIPYLRDAVGRGDPRAQYLLGIAHFNGDFIDKDWVRAYALVSLANGQGLPQAAPAMAEMDRYIPLAQRQEAAALATRMQTEADAARAQQLASVQLARGGAVPRPAPQVVTSQTTTQSTGRDSNRPSVAAVEAAASAAEAAVGDAVRVTGTESPAKAGADYARPQVVAAVAPKPVSRPSPVPSPGVAPVPAPVSRATPPQASADGPWRVQLGAFSEAGNADRLWRQLGGQGVLVGKQKFLVPAGGLTKLQAGGFASRDRADAACAALKRGGHGCIVTR